MSKVVMAAWDDFFALVFAPAGIGAETAQAKECRRVFFAGFHAALWFAKDEVGGGDRTDEERVAMLQAAADECTAFFRNVKAGRA